MEWISVEDRLPEEDQKVIYYFEHTGVDIGFYKRIKYPKEFIGSTGDVYGNQFIGNAGFLTDDVTHWMPLPKNPKVTHTDK